ncbi:MAG: efflux RND transporter periplasmic adaptor subunit [Deltaproteobacteria bacterium]|nr:efflux RND transporter periplasmic adaptor subunit [Deltaproteobacteria bacterium]
MSHRSHFSCLPIFLILLLSLPACSSGKKEKTKTMPPALVVTAVARQQDVPIEIKTFGTMEAAESVTIKPMLSGELTKVAFREGQDVNEGALLFEVDPRPYQAALNKARASLDRNRIVMNNARKDYERYAPLAKEGIVSQEQAEGYRTRAETAAADLAADQAAVENAQTQLSYCTITAPISGRLGTLTVDRGNVVKANETALVSINKLIPIRATFTIPEQSLSLIRQRLAAGEMTVVAEVSGTAGFTEKGRVSFLDNAVDPATGTIRLKGQFANEQKRLWPGQFVTISLTLDVRKQAVVVPTQAVQTGQKGPFVFVVKPNNTAEARAVVPGPVYEAITVIDKGLQAGEQVVIDGQMRVIPGGKVEIKAANKPEMDAKDKPPEAATPVQAAASRE